MSRRYSREVAVSIWRVSEASSVRERKVNTHICIYLESERSKLSESKYNVLCETRE